MIKPIEAHEIKRIVNQEENQWRRIMYSWSSIINDLARIRDG